MKRKKVKLVYENRLSITDSYLNDLIRTADGVDNRDDLINAQGLIKKCLWRVRLKKKEKGS